MSANEPLQQPPGFAGVLADCIYAGSYMPIREVSITAALALLAGVCGRGFRTHTGKDLAMYIVLVARSGIGKDGIHDGIPSLIQLAAPIPGIDRLLRQEDFASGPALHKALLMEPGFQNLQGEVGRKFKGMADPGNKPMQELRTVLTKAYGSAYLDGKSYSRIEDCLAGVPFPALSLLGETTPGTFMESLSSDMMEDGFLSRFLTITYDGERPESNPDRTMALPGDLLAYWRGMLSRAVQFISRINCPEPTVVGFRYGEAADKLVRFEAECRAAINGTQDEAIRQMWNRAHLKALKIASILAVADNFAIPKIDLGHAVWGITAVRRDMATFERRKQEGDIGSDDHARLRKLLALIKNFILKGAPESYRIPPAMSQNGIVPRVYLQRCSSSLPLFNNHRMGAANALDSTLRTMCDNGHLMEVKKDAMAEHYNFHGKCYRVLSIPD